MSVPFTAALLAGSRVRANEDNRMELVVPNPAGGRGTYVLRWDSARERCRPTVHDTVLFQRISKLDRLDPATVRAAAWDVAAEGLAGPEARLTAESTAETDRLQRRQATLLLRVALLQQLDQKGLNVTSIAQWSAEVDRYATAALHRVAPSFGCSGAALERAVVATADAFAPVGSVLDEGRSRIATAVDQLQDARHDILQSLQTRGKSESVYLGSAIASTMGTSFTCATMLLASTRSLLADPLSLLKRWVAGGENLIALATRPEWLLDGWERVCLLWQTAQTEATRRSTLLQMGQLLPVLPRETIDWCKLPLPAGSLDPACRVTCFEDGWRTGGAAFAMVGRNEKLRAKSS